MPPLTEWYSGIDAIRGFLDWATGPDSQGPFRYVPTRANGGPAFGIYAGGQPFILQALVLEADRIAAITSFMNPALFTAFDLPPSLAT